MRERNPQFFERITKWVGSTQSFIFHTCVFTAFFIVTLVAVADRDTILLVWNTLVSLEAIYLAVFIQMTVNRHSEELEEVSEDVEDIQEDIEEISEDVEDIQEDVEEMVEDEAEEEAEELRKRQELVTLETLTKDVQRLLSDFETLKKSVISSSTQTLPLEQPEENK